MPLGTEYDECSGIYTVHTVIPLPTEEYEPVDLIYIGESGELSDRLDKSSNPPYNLKHEKYPKWKNHVIRNEGEVLLFAVTKVTPEDRIRAEAALIYHHHKKRKFKLPYNKEYKNNFDKPSTRIKNYGYTGLLSIDFIVH